MKIKLTSAFCREVTCPPHKRKEVYRCTEQTGFGLEVRATSKTYWLYYTTQDRKAAQIKIGGYADVPFDVAKRKAKELRSKVVLGGDPVEEKATRKAIITFKELSRMHVEHAEATLRSHACVEAAHRCYLVPRFGKQRLNEITPQSIERYFAELRQTLAPATVDRLRLVMNRSYRLAQGWNLAGVDRNPVTAVARPRYDNKRTCLLSPKEVERLLAACEKSSNKLLKPIVHLRPESTARYAHVGDKTLAAAVEAGATNLKLLETVA